MTRSAALGFGPEQIAAIVGRRVANELSPEWVEAAAAELVGPTGVTAHASTFTRRDAVRAWCDRLPDGVEVDRVVALTDALLDHEAGMVVPLDHTQETARSVAGDQVIRRADGRVVPAEADEPRYSTPELLALEQWVVNDAVARHDAGVAVAGDAAVEAARARRPPQAREQVTMVRRLATSGAGVEVVMGKAGAGKTFALDAARDAWQRSGIRVIGCALAARAAAEVEASAGIDSYTIDALLAALDRPGPGAGLAPGSVLVVDEAGMVGTRKLARLFDHAHRAAAKIVLVGDHHQLPAIDAGGVFHGLVHRLPVIELTDNRRQREEWEREALDELRAGDPAAALAAYTAAGRVVTGETAEAVREQLVADWWQARCEHDGYGEHGVMIAPRVADVADLNDRARARLGAVGELTGPTVGTAAGREFQAGDRIVCLRNDRRLGVVNGTRGQITSVDPDVGTVTARVDDDQRTVELPRTYLDRGHLAHGYAITGHKAQGLTTRQAWALGSDAVYREWGYVALSRARHATHLYIVNGEPADDLDAHGVAEPPDPARQFGRALGRSRNQQLALDHTDPVPEPAPGHGAAEPSTTRPAAATRLRHLTDQRDAAAAELAAVEQRLAGLTARLDQRSLLDRMVNRAEARTARAEIVRLSGDVDAWRVHLAALDDELAAARRCAADDRDRINPIEPRVVPEIHAEHRVREPELDLDIGMS